MEEILSSVSKRESELIPEEVPWKFSYGTAGFRDKAFKLERVVFRIGLLAVLRSKFKEAAVGVVITASHNPVEDNGVKVVDPLGEMLSQDWETHATRLANVSQSDLGAVLQDIVATVGCDFNKPAHIIVARDTRPSGEKLVQILQEAASALSARVSDYGVMTTPQLHYMVRCVNTGAAFGKPSEEGYYQKLVSGFNVLLSPGDRVCLKLDGANGVGAVKIRELLRHFQDQNVLNVELFNDGSGVLNREVTLKLTSPSLPENLRCGADYVKTGQKPPEGMSFHEGDKCVSFDGDADRIVYFFKDRGIFKLLDGDKIAALAANFIVEQLRIMSLTLTIGVVQTAYANGNSTNYLSKTLGVSVACTKTGVKHLHHKAEDYDVGIYFEANGHGTVLFSDQAVANFKVNMEKGSTAEIREAAKKLHALTLLINQTVGDAMSDMLMVEAILLQKKWGCTEWYQLYQDLPSRQLKVQVQDRTIVKTVDFERRCESPAGLQEEIDALVRNATHGRAFIRPSGTEDVVRVYAEAASQVSCQPGLGFGRHSRMSLEEEADELAQQVKVKVHQLAGGVGELSH